MRTCSTPALPAGPITALQAADLWKRHFAERGVTEPDHSSHHIIAFLLGAKTVSGDLTHSALPDVMSEFTCNPYCSYMQISLFRSKVSSRGN